MPHVMCIEHMYSAAVLTSSPLMSPKLRLIFKYTVPLRVRMAYMICSKVAAVYPAKPGIFAANALCTGCSCSGYYPEHMSRHCTISYSLHATRSIKCCTWLADYNSAIRAAAAYVEHAHCAGRLMMSIRR